MKLKLQSDNRWSLIPENDEENKDLEHLIKSTVLGSPIARYVGYTRDHNLTVQLEYLDTVTNMARDWETIGALEDLNLKLAVSCARGKTLECFKRGFPHLFRSGEGEDTFMVPLSAIREEVRLNIEYRTLPEYLRFDTEVNFYAGLEVDKRLLGVVIQWGEEDEKDSDIPPGIAEQLVGHPIGPNPLKITLRKEQYIVVAVIIQRNDEYYIPPSGELLSKDDRITQLWVINAKFIDQDA